jgi:signal transduction histidine kinase
MVLTDMTELLEDSKIGFDRVSEIVSSLRNFAHTDQNSTKDSEDIHDILDEVLLILNNEIKYIATIDRQYGEVPQIYCHRGQMGQVFINLLMNAVHAIKAAKDHEMGTLTLTTWLDTEFQQVCTRISDDGCGIPAEVLPFIFNPFYTTKAVGEGTGLGLSISYDIIVNKHNGTIHVESTVGKGTQFTIRLPY